MNGNGRVQHGFVLTCRATQFHYAELDGIRVLVVDDFEIVRADSPERMLLMDPKSNIGEGWLLEPRNGGQRITGD